MKQGDRRDRRLGLVIIMKMDKGRPALSAHHITKALLFSKSKSH
jgi:hypothetical protein